MKLVISLATRGRPQQLVETIKRTVANITLPDTILGIEVDADDLSTIEALLSAGYQERVIHDHTFFRVEFRADTIAEKWNRALDIPGDVYLVAADDAPHITPAFDAKILEAANRFPDGIGMVYGHLANLSFADPIAATSKFCEKQGGFLFPPYFPYWFVDHWTDDVARMIGRVSFADVRTDQSSVGKTQELRESGWWASWFDAAYRMRRKIAHGIIRGDDFQSPQWLKDVLLNSNVLIEERSRGVNENVRAQAKQLDSWSNLSLKDERYQRVRARAVEMIPHLLDDFGMPPDDQARFRSLLLLPEMPGMKKAYA